MTVWQVREAIGYGKEKVEKVSIPDKVKSEAEKPDDKTEKQTSEDKPAK